MSKNMIKYSEAVERLDELLKQIEDDDIDVDELSAHVQEAVELLRVCKAKIDKAELEVKKVVENFAKEDKENG